MPAQVPSPKSSHGPIFPVQWLHEVQQVENTPLSKAEGWNNPLFVNSRLSESVSRMLGVVESKGLQKHLLV